jgi:hypothetical protein
VFSGFKPKIGLRLWSVVSLAILAFLSFLFLSLVLVHPETISGVGLLLLKGEIGQILSPKTGTLENWLKEEGDAVKKGEIVAHLMDYDTNQVVKVLANTDGIIAEIVSYNNTRVQKGDALAIITSHGDVRHDLQVIGFVSSLEGKKIKAGMDAVVNPSVSDEFRAGHMHATVIKVGKLPMSKASVQSLVKIPEVAKYIRSQIKAEPFVVYLSLTPDEKNLTGYQWSGPGPGFTLDSGTYVEISIIYQKPTFFELLWPTLGYWFRS